MSRSRRIREGESFEQHFQQSDEDEEEEAGALETLQSFVTGVDVAAGSQAPRLLARNEESPSPHNTRFPLRTTVSLLQNDQDAAQTALSVSGLNAASDDTDAVVNPLPGAIGLPLNDVEAPNQEVVQTIDRTNIGLHAGSMQLHASMRAAAVGSSSANSIGIAENSGISPVLSPSMHNSSGLHAAPSSEVGTPVKRGILRIPSVQHTSDDSFVDGRPRTADGFAKSRAVSNGEDVASELGSRARGHVKFGEPSSLTIDSEASPGMRAMITIFHANHHEIITDDQLMPFGVGATLYQYNGKQSNTTVTEVPMALNDEDMCLLPAEMLDSGISSHHYISIKFRHPCRVYLLLPSLMKSPRWLGEPFEPMRGTRVHVKWSTSFAHRLLLWLAQRLDEYQVQHMAVFRSKRVFQPDEELRLGGPDGSGSFTALNYVLLFRFGDTPDAAEKQTHHRTKSDHFRRVMSAVERQDLDAMKQLLGHDVLPEQLKPHNWSSLVQLAHQQNEHEMVRMLVQSGFARDCGQPYLSHLMRDAVARHDAELVMAVTRHSDAELDYKTLRFLIHNWPELQNLDVEWYLVEYVLKKRNPISVTAAIICAMKQELVEYEELRRHVRRPHERFYSLHISLIRRLSGYARLLEEERMQRGLPTFEQILEPALKPRSINDFSPLVAAFDLHDKRVMSTLLMSVYTFARWRGQEFLRLTRQTDVRDVSLYGPALLYTMMANAGLAGSALDSMLMLSARLWHCATLTSTAFFMSPRGRWAIQCASDMVFLIIFQLLLSSNQDNAELHYVYLAYVAGNFVDVGAYLVLRHASLKRYMRDPWSALNVLSNGALLALMVLRLMQIHGHIENIGSMDPVVLSLATMAPLVWIRSIGILTPLYPKISTLLTTSIRMMREVIAFLIPGTMILVGFATTFTSVFRDQLGAYNNFGMSMLTLFGSMLGQFDFSPLLDYEEQNALIYGSVILVVFLTITVVLLLNLLIAVMTDAYKPKETNAETLFKEASMVNYYSMQVKYGLMSSPWSLLMCPLYFLPSGSRRKLSHRKYLHWGLPPLDGISLEGDSEDSAFMIPTGRSEFPHLVYLLTLHPTMVLLSNILFILYAPFGILYFAMSGHSVLFHDESMLLFSFRSNGNSPSNAGGVAGGGGDLGRPTRVASWHAGNKTFAVFPTAKHSEAGVAGSKGSGSVPAPPPRHSLVYALTVVPVLATCRFVFFFLIGILVYVPIYVVVIVIVPLYTWLAHLVLALYYMLGWGLVVLYKRGRTQISADLSGHSVTASAKVHPMQQPVHDPVSVKAGAGTMSSSGAASRSESPTPDSRANSEHARAAAAGAARKQLIANKWRQAHLLVQRKVFRKEQRYLSREELLLAIKRSRFKHYMERWGLHQTKLEYDEAAEAQNDDWTDDDDEPNDNEDMDPAMSLLHFQVSLLQDHVRLIHRILGPLQQTTSRILPEIVKHVLGIDQRLVLAQGPHARRRSAGQEPRGITPRANFADAAFSAQAVSEAQHAWDAIPAVAHAASAASSMAAPTTRGSKEHPIASAAAATAAAAAPGGHLQDESLALAASGSTELPPPPSNLGASMSRLSGEAGAAGPPAPAWGPGSHAGANSSGSQQQGVGVTLPFRKSESGWEGMAPGVSSSGSLQGRGPGGSGAAPSQHHLDELVQGLVQQPQQSERADALVAALLNRVSSLELRQQQHGERMEALITALLGKISSLEQQQQHKQ